MATTEKDNNKNSGRKEILGKIQKALGNVLMMSNPFDIYSVLKMVAGSIKPRKSNNSGGFGGMDFSQMMQNQVGTQLLISHLGTLTDESLQNILKTVSSQQFLMYVMTMSGGGSEGMNPMMMSAIFGGGNNEGEGGMNPVMMAMMMSNNNDGDSGGVDIKKLIWMQALTGNKDFSFNPMALMGMGGLGLGGGGNSAGSSELFGSPY